jgi:hypothetical protein
VKQSVDGAHRITAGVAQLMDLDLTAATINHSCEVCDHGVSRSHIQAAHEELVEQRDL